MGIPMTREHYTEADLLETYYTQPGESMPVMMHLASCPDCAARYEKLERKMRDVASCSSEKPATFWSRQRLSIMRTIGNARAGSATSMRPARLAAAAALTFFLGGAVVYKSLEPKLEPQPQPPPAPVIVVQEIEDDETTRDPWQSDELQDFHSVVQWETWGDANNKGGKS